MILKYDNVFEARLGALDKSLHDKECSELLISIHGILDFENAPIKNLVKRFGVTSAYDKHLAKRDLNKFGMTTSFVWFNRSRLVNLNYFIVCRQEL